MTREEAIGRWQEARFGLAVHWGVYSLVERGEWVQYRERIPVKEYERLAEGFRAEKFDADEWVRLAKDSGMRYLIVTARHYDGFSLFRTAADRFNIADATPFGRDALAELAEACRREGVKLGIGYSHVRNWRHPRAQSLEAQESPAVLNNYGNFWDYPNENIKDVQSLIDEADIPQLKELLTQYGDIMTIRFDAPSLIRPDQAEQLKRLVRSLQPECLIGSGLSGEIETDYRSLGEGGMPSFCSGAPWEAEALCTGERGYRQGAEARGWEELLERLIQAAGRGGNLLLSVGADGQGEIPQQVRRELKKVGVWLRKNGEAVYGTLPSPFDCDPEWGRITRRGSRLYLIVTDQAAYSVSLTGLRNRVLSCRALDSGDALIWEEKHDAERDRHALIVKLTGQAGRFRVAVLTLDGEADVSGRLAPEGDGRIVLPAARAERLNGSGGEGIGVSLNGATVGWTDARDHIRWQFETERAGYYEVSVLLRGCGAPLEWGHEIDIELDDQMISLSMESGGYREHEAPVCRIWLPDGRHVLTVSPESIARGSGRGLNLAACRLTPVS